jgi:hypothetical protein
LIFSNQAEFLSGEFIFLKTGDHNSKHTDCNYVLVTLKVSLLYDYPNVKYLLIYGPEKPLRFAAVRLP